MVYAALGCLILVWCVVMPGKFHFERTKQRALEIICKTLATLLVAGLAATALLDGQADLPAKLILVGLCVCAAADAMLELVFPVGGALFFTGHVIYIAAFLLLRPLTWWSLAVFVPLLALLLYILYGRYRNEIHAAHPLLIVGLTVYAVALSSMVSTALPTPFLAFSPRMLCAAVGAVLFLISDATLLRNTLLERPAKDRFISLGIYYTGQLLIACAAIF